MRMRFLEMDSNLILFRKGRKKLCGKRNVDIYNRIFEESKSEKLLLFLHLFSSFTLFVREGRSTLFPPSFSTSTHLLLEREMGRIMRRFSCFNSFSFLFEKEGRNRGMKSQKSGLLGVSPLFLKKTKCECIKNSDKTWRCLKF